jgi:hypothetical protein
MNSTNLQNRKPQNDSRRAVITLSLLLLISLVLMPAAAQSRTKHITSIWTSTGSDGARVHVISDSTVSDYEAYKRGDRFYVKIPSAELPTARGSLLGRGFDDVQIQRYGDGIILSFHLQPGTTARVEQNLNRLEIVFATLAGHQNSSALKGSSEAINRTRARRIADIAGPAPSSTKVAKSSRQPAIRRDLMAESQPRKTTTGRTTNSSGAKAIAGNSPQRGGTPTSTPKSSKSPAKSPSEPRPVQGTSAGRGASAPPEKTSVAKKITPSPSPSPSVSPTPKASPSPLATPSPAASASPTAPASGSYTSASPESAPASVATPEPTPSASPSPAPAAGSIDWAAKVHYWKVWAELNWLPLLIGGFVGLALLVSMISWRGRKRRRAAADKTGAKPKAGPTVSVATRESGQPTETGAAAESSAPPQVSTLPQTRPASPANSSASLPGRQPKDGGEDQEREVFEI